MKLISKYHKFAFFTMALIFSMAGCQPQQKNLEDKALALVATGKISADQLKTAIEDPASITNNPEFQNLSSAEKALLSEYVSQENAARRANNNMLDILGQASTPSPAAVAETTLKNVSFNATAQGKNVWVVQQTLPSFNNQLAVLVVGNDYNENTMEWYLNWFQMSSAKEKVTARISGIASKSKDKLKARVCESASTNKLEVLYSKSLTVGTLSVFSQGDYETGRTLFNLPIRQGYSLLQGYEVSQIKVNAEGVIDSIHLTNGGFQSQSPIVERKQDETPVELNDPVNLDKYLSILAELENEIKVSHENGTNICAPAGESPEAQ